MDKRKRKALESSGWKVGDAADWLELTPEERQILDLKVKLAQAIRRLRQLGNLSQKELATRLKTSQPRVAKIEGACGDVSLDQLVSALTAAGGKLVTRSSVGKRQQAGRKNKQAKASVVVRVTVESVP